MLMRFDPFRELDRMADVLGQRTGVERLRSVPMGASRRADRLVVRFDLPGVDPGSIDLTVDKNVLTVRAERRWEPEEDEEVLVAERVQGAFQRELFLGDALDTTRVDATYEHGVLTLSVPIAEQAKPRKVQVTTAGGSRTIDAEPSGGPPDR